MEVKRKKMIKHDKTGKVIRSEMIIYATRIEKNQAKKSQKDSNSTGKVKRTKKKTTRTHIRSQKDRLDWAIKLTDKNDCTGKVTRIEIIVSEKSQGQK